MYGNVTNMMRKSCFRHIGDKQNFVLNYIWNLGPHPDYFRDKAKETTEYVFCGLRKSLPTRLKKSACELHIKHIASKPQNGLDSNGGCRFDKGLQPLCSELWQFLKWFRGVSMLATKYRRLKVKSLIKNRAGWTSPPQFCKIFVGCNVNEDYNVPSRGDTDFS